MTFTAEETDCIRYSFATGQQDAANVCDVDEIPSREELLAYAPRIEELEGEGFSPAAVAAAMAAWADGWISKAYQMRADWIERHPPETDDE